MLIKLVYGEDDEKSVELDTAFSLFFISQMREKKLLGKDFLNSIAAGKLDLNNMDDILNMPYCCYLNATKDAMDREDFEKRFIFDVPFLRDIYTLVLVGDTTDSNMKNIFKQPPKTKVKGHPTSGD